MEHADLGRNPGDPYRVLGVSAGASQRDIARAYRRAVQHAHPDARPRDPAAARFQALTDGYDRGHPAAEPSGQRPRPGEPAAASRWRGSPFLLRPPPGSPIWAGPVHVEPSAAAPPTTQHGRSAEAAEVGDPVVILGPTRGQVWGWPW